jgi:hypothetical protein
MQHLRDAEARVQRHGGDVNALGDAFLAADLAAEQALGGAIPDEGESERPAAHIWRARRSGDGERVGREAVSARFAEAEAGFGELELKNFRRHGADDPREARMASGGVFAGDAALLVRRRAERNVGGTASDKMQRFGTITRSVNAGEVGLLAIVHGDGAGYAAGNSRGFGEGAARNNTRGEKNNFGGLAAGSAMDAEFTGGIVAGDGSCGGRFAEGDLVARERGFDLRGDFGGSIFEWRRGAFENCDGDAARAKCFGTFERNVAGADDQSSRRLALVEELAEANRAGEIVAGENAGQIRAGNLRGGSAACREDELVVGDVNWLAAGAESANEFASGNDFGDFVMEADVNIAFVAKIFGGINEEIFPVGDLAREKIREAAGAVGNMSAFFENDDFKLRIEAARAARGAHARGHSSDNQQSLSRHAVSSVGVVSPLILCEGGCASSGGFRGDEKADPCLQWGRRRYRSTHLSKRQMRG